MIRRLASTTSTPQGSESTIFRKVNLTCAFSARLEQSAWLRSASTACSWVTSFCNSWYDFSRRLAAKLNSENASASTAAPACASVIGGFMGAG